MQSPGPWASFTPSAGGPWASLSEDLSDGGGGTGHREAGEGLQGETAKGPEANSELSKGPAHPVRAPPSIPPVTSLLGQSTLRPFGGALEGSAGPVASNSKPGPCAQAVALRPAARGCLPQRSPHSQRPDPALQDGGPLGGWPWHPEVWSMPLGPHSLASWLSCL